MAQRWTTFFAAAVLVANLACGGTNENTLPDSVEMPSVPSACAEPAIEMLLNRAEQGDYYATSCLGYRYAQGYGVQQDYEEATRWFRSLAEQGYAEEQHNLGAVYYTREDGRKDYLKAFPWFRLAAEQGHTGAQHALGLMYLFSRGVEQDGPQACMWFMLAGRGEASERTELAAEFSSDYLESAVPSYRDRCQSLIRAWDATHPR